MTDRPETVEDLIQWIRDMPATVLRHDPTEGEIAGIWITRACRDELADRIEAALKRERAFLDAGLDGDEGAVLWPQKAPK